MFAMADAYGRFAHERHNGMIFALFSIQAFSGKAPAIVFFRDHWEGNLMADNGLKALIAAYRKKFRIRENLRYYSKEDFQKAEKKYLKFCLTSGKC
jgi:hypothetical protein